MNELNVLNEIKRKVQRRRYALKLTNRSIVRALVVTLTFLLALGAVTNVASAREIRVFPTTADPLGVCAVVAPTSACDLVRAAAGLPPVFGPDAGVVPQPGDTLVLAPGNYLLAAVGGPPADGSGPMVIPGTTVVPYAAPPAGVGSGRIMENLTVRSRNGTAVTVIDGAFLPFPAVIVAADNVTFGGGSEEQGITIQNAGCDGIHVGSPGVCNPFGIDLAPGGQADQDITLQNLFITNNGTAVGGPGSGVYVDFVAPANGGFSTPRAIENYRFEHLNIRANAVNGVEFGPDVLAMGGSSEDEGIFILRNTIDSNGVIAGVGFGVAGNGISIDNEGDIEQLIIQENFIVRNEDNGLAFGLDINDADAVNTTQLEDVLIEGNQIKWNGFAGGAPSYLTYGAGIVFVNSGQIENTDIINNRDRNFKEGISGNAGSGILLDSAVADAALPVGIVGVQDLDTLNIVNNVINENGLGSAQVILAGPSNFPPFAPNYFARGFLAFVPCDGITFLNAGDLDPVTINDNNVRLNACAGVAVGAPGNTLGNQGFAHPGDFDSNEVSNNIFRNNGAWVTVSPLPVPGPVATGLFPHGDGFAVFSGSDVNDAVFENNEFIENYNNGLFLSSTTNDITGLTMKGNKANKNGLNLNVTIVPHGDGINVETFGDISEVLQDGDEASQNGGSGLLINANGDVLANRHYGCMLDPAPGPGPFPAPCAVLNNLGDLDGVDLLNSTYSVNGASAPIGAGDGIFMTADKVNDVMVDNATAEQNDDHGVLANSVDDMTDVTVQNSTFMGNDRNNDSVGSGIFFDSNDDMDTASAIGNVVSGNQIGIQYQVKGQNGRDLLVENNTADDNDKEGILVNGSDDLSQVTIRGNILNGNGIGITLRAVDRGGDLMIEGNAIEGDDGTGIGITLDAIGTSVTTNSVRRNGVGIKALRAQDSEIHNNNIARNEDFGIDALNLKPGETINAKDNWWGEPSGPKHSTNANGIGDRVSDKVDFQPWLGEPAVETDVNFQIMEFQAPATARVGETATITALIRNNGTQEGTQNLTLKIEGSDFVDQNTVTRTLNPATQMSVNFDVVFPRGGTYQVTLSTQNDSKSANVDVTGPTGLTIEGVCDANDNSRIDDDEILTCIGFWVTGQEVPGTGQTIGDAKILFLIELWVTNGDISTLPASAKASSWIESVVSFFAPAATVSHTSSSAEVAPGGSFTVTTTINANETLQGLLLREQLPAGWTMSQVTTSGGFYKASENKWLWLSAQGQTTVTYTVSVPADAATGAYQIAGNLDTAGGFSTASALSVRVAKPEALSVSKVSFTGNGFVAEGSGITGVEAQVYNLGGQQVFTGSNQGAALSFNGLNSTGQTLANGVYLYVVVVKGANGQQVQSAIGKLVVLR